MLHVSHTGIRIIGYPGTWRTIDNIVLNGERYSMLENEIFYEYLPLLVVNNDSKIILEDVEVTKEFIELRNYLRRR